MSAKMGSLIVDVEGYVLTPEESELLKHPLVGGVILFVRNYESKNQLKNLCQSIRRSRTESLLIMVDQEGGRVQRFVNEFTQIPSMSTFGILYDKNPNLALSSVQDCGWLLAAELLSAGVDVSLAPVLDLKKANSNVIGERAFHVDPKIVTELGKYFVVGMREAGMAAIGKHFPGHGSISADSHTEHPIDKRALSEIYKDDMIPFANLIHEGIAGIMAAHVVFPQIDDQPVGFSRIWLQDILRSQLHFKGLILSDCLSMEGANVSASYSDRFIRSRKAGCDLALVCNNRAGVISVLNDVSPDDYLIAKERWSLLQPKPSLLTGFTSQTRWKKTHDFLHSFRQ